MSNTARVCELRNEAEAEIVCATLDSQGIPYVLRKTEDSAYDGIYLAQAPWGFIEAPVEYADSIQQIAEDLRKKRRIGQPRATRRSTRRVQMTQQTVEVAILALLVGTIVFLAIRNGRLGSQIRHYANLSSVNWKWIPSEKAMAGTGKTTGRTRYKYYDRNFNNVYEEKVVYLAEDRGSITYFDRDEDGSDERIVVVNAARTVVSESEDANESDLFERQTFHYGEDKYVEYLDKDDDGVADEVIAHDGTRTRVIDLRSIFFPGQP